LIKINTVDYKDIIFFDGKDFYNITNNSDKKVQVLIKRSYFPTWITASGQKLKLINPNFIAIDLEPGQTETLYFSYPTVFYVGNYISLIGIILLAFVAFKKGNQ
jgi:hypothetical protein